MAKAEAEHAAEKEAGRAVEQAAEAQADANKIGSEAARQVALESAAHAAAAARKARAAASNAPSTYDSIEEMLELADLAVCGVSGDGNCGYYACLASRSECSMQHCRPGGRTTAPTQADYASQQALRNACVAWLQQPAQTPMIEMHERSEDSIAAQLNGNMGPPGSMGTYADAAALRAMAAVEKVHLVVITTNTARGIGRGQRGKPFDAVHVYSPNTETQLYRARSWAHDIVPALLRRAEGKAKRTDPKYRVILHNGEASGSRAGHFDGTVLCRSVHVHV